MDSEWWIDYSLPDGPSDYQPGDRLEYLAHRQKQFHAAFANIGRGFGKTFHGIAEALDINWKSQASSPADDLRAALSNGFPKPLIVSDEVLALLNIRMTEAVLEPLNDKTALELKAERANHGPRPYITFDRRGKRKY